jgi:hypothetical protein
MNRIPIWLAVAALATTLAAAPMTAMAQEAVPVVSDPLIIIGWQEDDGGPIMGHASDIQAMQLAQQAKLQAEIAADPVLLAGGTGDCTQ